MKTNARFVVNLTFSSLENVNRMVEEISAELIRDGFDISNHTINGVQCIIHLKDTASNTRSANYKKRRDELRNLFITDPRIKEYKMEEVK